MKKTYWWRIIIVFIDFLLLGISYILRNQHLFGLCDNVYNFSNRLGCLDKLGKFIGEPLFIMTVSLFIISPFLFFISDKIFLKWLSFAFVWIVITIIFVALAPVYTGGWMSFGPTKESISIWMGLLFVILSLVKINWDWKKSREK